MAEMLIKDFSGQSFVEGDLWLAEIVRLVEAFDTEKHKWWIKDKIRPVGVEPTTCGLEVRCSIQLSYGRSCNFRRILRGFRGGVGPLPNPRIDFPHPRVHPKGDFGWPGSEKIVATPDQACGD